MPAVLHEHDPTRLLHGSHPLASSLSKARSGHQGKHVLADLVSDSGLLRNLIGLASLLEDDVDRSIRRNRHHDVSIGPEQVVVLSAR